MYPTPCSHDRAPDEQDQTTAPAVPVEEMKTLNISSSSSSSSSSSNKNTNKVDKASRLGSIKPTLQHKTETKHGSFAPPSASGAGSAAKIQQFAATLSITTKNPEARAGPSLGNGGRSGEKDDGGDGDGDGEENDALASLVLMLAARKTGKKVVRRGKSVRKTMEE